MSEGGVARGRYVPLEWTLAAMPAVGVRHVGTCLVCSGHSVDTVDPDEAQLWCLKHAGMTRHTGYELTAFQFFSATITDPAVSEASPPT
ncbi:hypothetical protein ACGFSB_18800 [Streptomyces sp. NPDC048441]|uniref:DUF7848 domain-containing protein n=1 Tax=Streptomyces sp. NPDC048441 TaxID=3365552 RepID=UPI00371282CA